ncbi:hypothetical protein HYE68_002888 [Fusarium pseudograminearum]|nr:hypothetical protein HYE68_002888 [Fusarium pseudograminearum]
MRRGGFMLGELRVQVPRDVSTCQDDDSWPQVGSVRVSHESASLRQPHPKSFFSGLAEFCLAQKQDARENPSRRMLARGGGVQLVRGEMIKKGLQGLNSAPNAAESPTSMPSDFHYSTVYTSPPWMLTR